MVSVRVAIRCITTLYRNNIANIAYVAPSTLMSSGVAACVDCGGDDTDGCVGDPDGL